MKRLWWSVAICLAVALAVPLAWEGFSSGAGGKAVRSVKEIRFIQPRLTMGSIYSRCEPRAEENGTFSPVWCSAPPGAGQALLRSTAKAARRTGGGPSRGSERVAGACEPGSTHKRVPCPARLS